MMENNVMFNTTLPFMHNSSQEFKLADGVQKFPDLISEKYGND